jgi:hypothetical protein
VPRRATPVAERQPTPSCRLPRDAVAAQGVMPPHADIRRREEAADGAIRATQYTHADYSFSADHFHFHFAAATTFSFFILMRGLRIIF